MISKERLDKLRHFASVKSSRGENALVDADLLMLLIDERNHFSNALTYLERFAPAGIQIVARALSETTHEYIGSQKV